MTKPRAYENGSPAITNSADAAPHQGQRQRQRSRDLAPTPEARPSPCPPDVNVGQRLLAVNPPRALALLGALFKSDVTVTLRLSQVRPQLAVPRPLFVVSANRCVA